MKRLTCILAALAMVMLTHIPAQAEFLGTLQRDQPWSLGVDNSNNTHPATVTIFYLGSKDPNFDIYTVPAVTDLNLTNFRIPKGTRRIVVEVDPSFGEPTGGLVTQQASGFPLFSDPARGGETFRFVFDVV